MYCEDVPHLQSLTSLHQLEILDCSRNSMLTKLDDISRLRLLRCTECPKLTIRDVFQLLETLECDASLDHPLNKRFTRQLESDGSDPYAPARPC
jgi:hypothetical protein